MNEVSVNGIIPWFLVVKVGEIEFENWGVGCVCKSFPL